MTGKKEMIFCFESFYPSNIPYSHILKDIVEECCNRGYLVRIITTYNYNEKEQKKMLDFFDSKSIKYALFKMGASPKVNNIFFPVFVFIQLLIHGKGVAVITSTPPVLMGFSAFLAKLFSFSRFNYVYHCQDIHPEALEISNKINNKVIINLLRFLDSITVKYAKNNIVLSRNMKRTLNSRNKGSNNISIINNFIPSAYDHSEASATESRVIRDNHTKDDLIFVYAGNLGAFQNLDTLLEAFLEFDDTHRVFLYFIGEGKVKNTLLNTLSNYTSRKKNVIFLEKMDSEDIINYIEGADYGVVSLSEGLLDVA